MRRALLLVLLALSLAAGGFVVWAVAARAAMPEALAALKSDEVIAVEAKEQWITFGLRGTCPQTGLILYPGARVDYRAYAPAARSIAGAGYLVVLVRMPLNLAIFAPDRAADVIASFPKVAKWVVGGHSLGGAMAARFAYRKPEGVKGLVLWAAYPASTDSLLGRTINVTSISGSLDGLATVQKVEASRPLLPTQTEWVVIEGGNHAQFGWYGVQSGDREATISRSDQQSRIVGATISLLKKVDAGGAK